MLDFCRTELMMPKIGFARVPSPCGTTRLCSRPGSLEDGNSTGVGAKQERSCFRLWWVGYGLHSVGYIFICIKFVLLQNIFPNKITL